MIGDNGQLFGWSEQTWLWLGQLGTLSGNLMVVLSFTGAVYAWLRRDAIRLWFRTNRFPQAGGQTDASSEQWQGIVFTVSRPDVSSWVMSRIKPRAVAFLATQASRHASDELVRQANKQHIEVIGQYFIGNPDDPAEIREQTTFFIGKMRSMGYDKVAVDITGGKTTMSIGAFMAAEESGAPSLYVSAEYDKQLKKPDTTSARIRCISDPRRL